MRRSLRTATAAVAAVLALAPGAFAQNAPADPAAMEVRRQLLEQVFRAREAGHHEEALQLLDRAGQIAMNSSVRRAQAQELEALGRYAEALGRASECLSEAQHEAPSPARNEVLEDCRALTRSLEPRVGRVVLQVPPDAPPGLVVRVDGREVGSALWGTGYPVTPGTVVVEAAGPNVVAFRRDVTVGAGGQVQVSVEVRAQEAAAAGAGGAATAPAPVPSQGGSIVPAAVLLAGGGAGVVASVVFFVLAAGDVSSLNAQCAQESGVRVCDDTPALRSLDSRARSYEITADVLLGAGVAAAAAGVVLLLTSGGHEARPSATRVYLAPVAGGVTFGVGGSL